MVRDDILENINNMTQNGFKSGVKKPTLQEIYAQYQSQNQKEPTWTEVIAENLPNIAKIASAAFIKDPYQQGGIAQSLTDEQERQNARKEAYKQAQEQKAKDFLDINYKQAKLDNEEAGKLNKKEWNTDLANIYRIMKDPDASKEDKDFIMNYTMYNKDPELQRNLKFAGAEGTGAGNLVHAEDIAKATQTGKEKGELGYINLKEYQKEYADIRNSAKEAQNMNNTYTDMEKLLDTGIKTGTLANAELEAKKLLNVFGIDSKGLAEGQAFKALGNQLALRMRNPSSGFGLTGNTSDRDVKFLKSTVPQISNTPEGNRLIIKLAKAVNNRKIEQLKIAEQYVQENGYYNPIEVNKQIDKLNSTSMFGEDLIKEVESMVGGSKAPKNDRLGIF